MAILDYTLLTKEIAIQPWTCPNVQSDAVYNFHIGIMPDTQSTWKFTVVAHRVSAATLSGKYPLTTAQSIISQLLNLCR